MASQYGRNGFTVQEATNSSAYTSYKFEEINTGDSGSAVEGTDWAALAQPAKEINIYDQAGATNDDTDIQITLKVNGSYGTAITIDTADLPFKVTGLLVDQVKIHAADDVFSILSFH